MSKFHLSKKVGYAGMIKKAVQFGSFNTVIFRKPPENGIFLTFDDGPDGCFTIEALEILARYGARATFFLVGENVVKFPRVVWQIKEQGHGIGLHTFTHKAINDMGREEFVNEIALNRSALNTLIPDPIYLLRPPFGRISLRNVYWAFEMGLKLVHYTAVLYDWESRSKEEIVHRFNGLKLTGGEIILLHENNSHTLGALPTILESIRSQGFIAQPLK